MRLTGDDRVRLADAAVLAGLSRGYFAELRAEGRGPVAVKSGSHWFFKLADLAAWMAEREGEE